jgi:tetratricopeptide (TPR) repeat protein
MRIAASGGDGEGKGAQAVTSKPYNNGGNPGMYRRYTRLRKKHKIQRRRWEQPQWWVPIVLSVCIGIIVTHYYANRSSRDVEKIITDTVPAIVDQRGSLTETRLQEYLDGLLINPDQRKVDLVKLGQAYADSGKYEEAIVTFRKRMAMGAEPNEQIALHILIGNAFYYLDRWAETEGAWNEAQRVAEEHDDRGGLATALNNLGLLYSNTQRLEQAEKAYQEVLQIMRRS